MPEDELLDALPDDPVVELLVDVVKPLAPDDAEVVAEPEEVEAGAGEN